MIHNKQLSLRVNFIWTLVGNLIYSLSQWGIMVVLTRCGTMEMVGNFALGVAIVAPFALTFNLQLRSIQATDAKKEFSFNSYFGLRIITTAGMLIVASMFAYFTYDDLTVFIIFCTAIAKGTESISDIFYGLFQQHERMDKSAQSLIVKGIMTLMVVYIIVCQLESKNILVVILCMAAIWGINWLLFDVRRGLFILQHAFPEKTAWQVLMPQFELLPLKNLVITSMPLGAVALFLTLNPNLPNYAIDAFLGRNAFGIFAPLVYVMTAENVIVNALGQSANARLATLYAKNQITEFRHVLQRMLGIALLIGITGIVMAVIGGKLVLQFLYGANFINHTELFTWLMIAAMLVNIASMLNYAIISTRQFNEFLLVVILSTVLNFLLLLWLVPLIGLLGAAIAIVIGAIFHIMANITVLALAQFNLKMQYQ
ncbi:hypothetical protein TI04_01250 [Achromatium sp. WMS2]|nr:hypothetical protein TI04_01250 [Achromatium sp. WMS2]